VKYREHPPHESLSGHVKCFWTLERRYTPENPAEGVTPDAFIELIFNFGERYVLKREGRAGREMPGVFLVGLQKKPLRFRCDGMVKILAARFYAWGVLPFFGNRARETGVPGREWDELAAKLEPLVRAGNDDAAVAMLQDRFVEELLAATADPKQVRAAARMLHLQKGQFRVTELAERCGLSSRQLQRQFRDVVGVSPKALARLIRFEEIRKRLMFDPDRSLTDLAHEFEYTDQAHFIRDFREFADRTPGEFAREMRAIREIFHDRDNVVFLQAPPAASR